jgi:hypothetical protein
MCVGAGFIIYVAGLSVLRVPEMRDARTLLPRRSTDVGSEI